MLTKQSKTKNTILIIDDARMQCDTCWLIYVNLILWQELLNQWIKKIQTINEIIQREKIKHIIQLIYHKSLVFLTRIFYYVRVV